VFLRAGRAKTLLAVGAMIALIAVADWSVGSRASLGVLYILPMMLGAIVLAPWQTTILALICSSLRSWFDIPSPHIEMLLRFIFASLTYAGSGLFVTALIRNRDLEEQLKTLVESSPAAILTTDGFGKVLAANRAADSLFLMAKKETLKGRTISDYVPLLGDALALADRPEHFRTAAQCQGRKDNGEIFLAQVWFSSYPTPEGARLAIVTADGDLARASAGQAVVLTFADEIDVGRGDLLASPRSRPDFAAPQRVRPILRRGHYSSSRAYSEGQATWLYPERNPPDGGRQRSKFIQLADAGPGAGATAGANRVAAATALGD